MNINNINAASSNGVTSNQSKSSVFQNLGEKGQVIDGLISKVSDMISINFSGKEVSAPKSAVREPKEGELRKFEIMDVSDTSIVLKEVGNQNNPLGMICTTVEIDKFIFAEQFGKSLGKNQNDAKSIQRNLNSISNRLTEEDYNELSQEGFSLESYNLERLNRAIERIKDQRIFKEHCMENQVEKQGEYSEQVEKIAVNNIASGPLGDKVVKSLLAANLPVTTENVIKVMNTMELAYSVNNMSDNAIGYMIKNELDPTIENIYHGQYSGKAASAIASKNDYQQLQIQIEEVIIRAGMEVNADSIEKGKWLFLNQLPVTEKTLSSLASLERIRAESTPDSILNSIMSAMAKGMEPQEASLDNSGLIQAKQIVDDFNGISNQAVDLTIAKGQDVNLIGLKLAQDEINQSEIEVAMNLTDIARITARRQLEEIRLKMTVEAGQRLIGKGINLETSGLEKIVEGLRELENQYYKNLMQEANVSENMNQIDLLRETTEKVEGLKGLPSYVLGITLRQRTVQTIDTLYEVGAKLKGVLNKAGEAYDSLMTMPRKDMGDSIEKAFQNVGDILEDLQLENTEANSRAVKILGYNAMEITVESVFQVKSYDEQVNTLIKNLHPAVTVEMIKEGINPLETPIAELNEQINQRKEKLGLSQEEKYSKYLWKLEKEEGISAEERKSYIGVYRLLNNVEKTKGAAVGAVLQANQEVTLRNLLTAVRTMKSGGIQADINDNFGLLEELNFQRENITDQITSAFESQESEGTLTDRIEYMNGILRNVIEEITPSKLETITDSNLDQVLDMSMEKIKEGLTKIEEEGAVEKEYLEEQVKQIRDIAGSSQEEIAFLASREVPVSVHNLISAHKILENGGGLFQEIKKKVETFSEEDKKILSEVIGGFEEAMGDITSLQNQYEIAEEKIQQIWGKQYEGNEMTSRGVMELKRLGNGIELAKKLSKQESYEIPIEVEGKITNIRLTVLHGKKQSGKVHIKIHSEFLGKIETDFDVKDNGVRGLTLCNNREGLEYLLAEKDNMTETLKGMGLQVSQLDYWFEAVPERGFINVGTMVKEENKTSDTNTLYQVAKEFVKTIKTIEARQA